MNNSSIQQNQDTSAYVIEMTEDEYAEIVQERRNGEFMDIENDEYITDEEIIQLTRLILNSGLLSEESLQEIAQAGIISYSPEDGTISYPPIEQDKE